jgi:aspartate racemase
MITVTKHHKVPLTMLTGTRHQTLPHIKTSTITEAILYYEGIMRASHAKSDQDHPPMIIEIGNNKNAPPIGIIGGMGPQATLYLLKQFPKNTQPIIVAMVPHIGDRTESLLIPNNLLLRQNIEAVLKGSSQYLAECSHILLPCNTAHAFAKAIEGNFVNMIEKTAKYLVKKNIKKIISFATHGTHQTNIYPDTFSACIGNKIDVIKPNDTKQQLMAEIIYNHIKKNGITDKAISLYTDLVMLYIDEFIASGKESHIHIGYFCTEFPLVGEDERTIEMLKKKTPYYDCVSTYDPMEIMVRSVISN